MHIARIHSTENAGKLFSAAKDFLLPQEKFYCALMQRILNRSENIFIITPAPNINSILGLFFYNGHTLTPYIPNRTQDISDALRIFFVPNKVTCISGESSSVLYVREIYSSVAGHSDEEVRSLFLMQKEITSAKKYHASSAPQETRLVHCAPKHAKDLLHLQTSYSREEVLPAWQEMLPYLERHSLDVALKNQHVLALKNKDHFIAKAQTNAITKNFWQIGGVYTEKSFRNRGLASFLVNEISLMAQEKNAGTVLYVRRQNLSAINAYKKAGFKFCGEYSIIYFN